MYAFTGVTYWNIDDSKAAVSPQSPSHAPLELPDLSAGSFLSLPAIVYCVHNLGEVPRECCGFPELPASYKP